MRWEDLIRARTFCMTQATMHCNNKIIGFIFDSNVFCWNMCPSLIKKTCKAGSSSAPILERRNKIDWFNITGNFWLGILTFSSIFILYTYACFHKYTFVSYYWALPVSFELVSKVCPSLCSSSHLIAHGRAKGHVAAWEPASGAVDLAELVNEPN